jgi:hypothetical protein
MGHVGYFSIARVRIVLPRSHAIEPSKDNSLKDVDSGCKEIRLL